MISSFFPLTIPVDAQLLHQLAPGLIWICLLLCLLLASERLFQQDFEDGVIDQWLISADSITTIVSAKLLIHWIVTILPILLFCPVFTVFFNLSSGELGVLLISLLLGSPFILCLCALAVTFSLGMQQKGAFIALILLPFTIPALIFGSGTVLIAMEGLSVSGHFAILAALSILAITFLPLVIAKLISAIVAN
jgi:heme exporter protein B